MYERVYAVRVCVGVFVRARWMHYSTKKHKLTATVTIAAIGKW